MKTVKKPVKKPVKKSTPLQKADWPLAKQLHTMMSQYRSLMAMFGVSPKMIVNNPYLKESNLLLEKAGYKFLQIKP